MRKGLRVPCGTNALADLLNSVNAVGLGARAQQKKEVVTTGAGTTGYGNKPARPICVGSKK
jgi:hypothetical protein